MLDGIVRACTATLRRLGTDRLDLYLLHRRGTIDLGSASKASRRCATAG